MTSKTSYLIGLIGSGIAGSLTPTMHEQESRTLGLNYVYRLGASICRRCNSNRPRCPIC